MKRTFPQVFTIAANNSANPLVYTTSTAAITPPGLSGQGGTAYAVRPTLATLAANNIFIPQDLISVEPGNANAEIIRVISTPSNNTITAEFKKAHAANVYIGLHFKIASLYVQTVAGGANAIYLGNNKGMSSNSWLIAQVQKTSANTQPYDWTDNEQGSGINPLNTNEYWAYGTAGDQYNVVLTYI